MNNNVWNKEVNNYSQNNNQWNNQNNIPQWNNQYGMMNNTKKSDNKLKIILLILIVVLVGFIVFAILPEKEKTSSNPHTNTDYERTIMIYMVGANLESENGFATLDLNGINYDTLNNESTKVILIAGGSKRWKNNYIDVNNTSIYELTNDGYKVVKDQKRKNMGEASLLSEFLNYGFDNYKSKKYDLILWNHGQGVLGGELDEFTGDYLSLPEMKKALSDSRFSSDNKLELVLFRTCLNGTIEVADTFKDYAQYMIASQEVTRGYSGNNLLKVLNNIKKDDNGKDIGIKFCNGYMDYMNYYETQRKQSLAGTGTQIETLYNTYSVIDLSKVKNLENSINEFFEDINLNSNYDQVARARASLFQYASEVPMYDSVDLYNLVRNLKSLSTAKGQKVLDNLEQAIVYNKATDSRSKGLSVYFPYRGKTSEKDFIINNYKFDDLSKYKTFITTFSKTLNNADSKLNFLDNTITFTNKEINSDFELELSDEQKKLYNKASYIVVKDNKNGTYLPVYSGKNVSLDGNKLKANIKGRQLKVINAKDNTSNILSLIEEDETDEYIKYETYGVLRKIDTDDIKNWLIESAKVEIILDKKSNNISLGNVYIKPKVETEKNKELLNMYTVLANLDSYDSISFASSSYKIFDSNGNYNDKWINTSDGIIKGLEANLSNLKFELEDYKDDSNYYAVFKIYDIYNKSYSSKMVKMK